MKKSLIINLLLTFLLACSSILINAQQTDRTRESFNENWKFVKYFNASDEAATFDKEPTGLESPSFNDNAWRTLNLPHDWAIEGPFSDMEGERVQVEYQPGLGISVVESGGLKDAVDDMGVPLLSAVEDLVDGGELGEISDETWTAKTATITFSGKPWDAL